MAGKKEKWRFRILLFCAVVFAALSGTGRTKTADAAGAGFDTKKTFYIYADQNRSMTIDGKAGTDNALVNLRADTALKVTFKEADNGFYALKLKGSDRYLELSGQYYQLSQHEKKVNNDKQKFRFVPVKGQEGMYYIQNKQFNSWLYASKDSTIKSGADYNRSPWYVISSEYGCMYERNNEQTAVQVSRFFEDANKVDILSEIWGLPVTKFATEMKGSTNMTSITVPDTFRDITAGTFMNAKKLKTVVLPSTITDIGENAFSGCTALTSISSLANVETIRESAFFGCTALTSIGSLSHVKAIGKEAFCGAAKLKSIELPASMDELGDRAFCQTGIQNVVLPQTTNIGQEVFRESAVQTASIPSGYKECPGHIFRSCKKLKSVDLPDTLESLGDYAFCECTALTSIAIPDKVEKINDYAFCLCSKLSTINFPAKLKVIGKYAFEQCKKLPEFTIPGGVTEIGAGAFQGCDSFKKFAWPKGISTMPQSILANCSNLATVEIPNGVTRLEADAFMNCKKIKTIELPDSIEFIGSSALSNTSIKSIKLPSRLKEIRSYVFNGTGIKELILPDGMQKLTEYPFYGSSIKTIYIPASVTEFVTSAFVDNHSGADYQLYIVKGSVAEQKLGTVGTVKKGLVSGKETPGYKVAGYYNPSETGSVFGRGSGMMAIVFSIIVVFAGLVGYVVFRRKTNKQGS